MICSLLAGRMPDFRDWSWHRWECRQEAVRVIDRNGPRRQLLTARWMVARVVGAAKSKSVMLTRQPEPFASYTRAAWLQACNARLMTPGLLVRPDTASSETDKLALGMVLLKVNGLIACSIYMADIIPDTDTQLPFLDIRRDAEVILTIHSGI